ncbi:MAG: hypothetical protein ACLQNE_39125 [Thermoguttaceae bacterium]|jgi:hypothetical protein
MITFSICISLVILAVIAAIFSQQPSDWVLPADRDLYFPPFFKSEGFYRAVLINLSFAGISTAAAAIQFVKYSTFWMICDPLLAIFLNLGLGLFAALCLKPESSEMKTLRRWAWAFGLLILGIVLFGFAVWTTVLLSSPPRPPPPT